MISTLLQNLRRLFQNLSGKSVTRAPVYPPSPSPSENNGYSEIATFTYLALENMLRLAGMPCRVSVYEDTAETLSLELENTPDTGRIIGKNGHTLKAFEILLKAFIQRKFGKRLSVVIDANNYRKRYEGKLAQKRTEFIP